MFKDYYAVRSWLESFIPYTYSKKNLGLERINYLLKLLGNPQNKFKSIHVAGTSGKGSTAFYIAKLLQYAFPVILANEVRPESNLFADSGRSQNDKKIIKIGLHVSPHLSYIGERMQIFQNQKFRSEIPVKKLIKLISEMKPVVEGIKKKKPSLTPSYFEILVATSFKYFADQEVDWAVVEVGLGGRLDATNVLRPKVSVITNIGLDHTDILGKSIEKIAKEKAGIIKEGVPIVTGASGRALEVIKKVARLASAPLIRVNSNSYGEPRRAKSKKAPLINLSTLLAKNHPKSDMFRYISKPYYLLRDSQNGFASFNKNLALLTVLTLLSLRDHEVAKQSFLIDRHVASLLAMTIDGDAVEKAFSTPFAGRFEEIVEGVILDGAHNLDKIRFLIRQLNTKYKIQNTKYTLVVAFKKGKNWEKMVDILVKNLPVKKIIATQFYAATDTGLFAAVETEEIRDYVTKVHSMKCKVYSNSQEAVFGAINAYSKQLTANSLQQTAASAKQVILVTGSLYLVGEARTLWYLPKF